MDDHAIGDLAGHLRHPRTDCGQKDLWRTVFIVSGGEKGRHQGVLVKPPRKLQWFAIVPIGPNGPHGQDELPHPRRRIRPRHAEALGDVGANLRTDAQHETPLGGGVQIVADVGQGHR